MPKSKRIVKKRIAKRKSTKKTDVKGGTPMTRLEYEQSMMDPRFRAAMYGFNNPVGSQILQANYARQEQENKNNELTRQMTYQNDINNLKKREIELKQEVKNAKQEAKNELDKARHEASIKQLEYDHNLAMEKKFHDRDITELTNQNKQLKREIEEEQKRHNQEQELLEKTHQQHLLESEKQHEVALHAIIETTKDLARKKDVENLQFNAAQEVADETLKKTKAEISKQLQDQLQPLKAATEQANRTIELTKTVYEGQKQVKDTIKDTLISEFKASIAPGLALLDQRNDDIKRNMELLNKQHQLIKEIKDAQHALTQSQIDAINQPVLNALKSQKQDYDNQYALNQKVFDEIAKQNELRTQIEQRKQVIDPQVRDEFNERLKAEKKETHQLELINAHAESAHKAYLEKEAVRSKIIENAAKVLPDFKVEDIDKPDFTKKLIDKDAELQRKIAEYSKQQELSERALNARHNEEQMMLEVAESQAKLSAVSTNDAEYMRALKKRAKHTQQLKQQINMYDSLAEDMDEGIRTRNESIDRATQSMVDFCEKYPQAKEIAYRIAEAKHKTNGILYPEDFPAVIQEIQQQYDTNKRVLADLQVKTDQLSFDEMQQVAELAEKMKVDGQFVKNIRSSAQTMIDEQNKQIEELIAERDQWLGEKENTQGRYKQAARALKSAYYRSTIPVTLTTDGMVYGSMGEEGDTNTISRQFPDGKQALRMTKDNFNAILRDGKIYDVGTLNEIIKDADDADLPSPTATPVSSPIK